MAYLLSHRGMKVDQRCQTCGLECESIHHVLFECDPARQVWALSGNPHPEVGFHEGIMFSSLNYILSLKWGSQEEADKRRACPWMVWFIWKSMNDLLFKGIRWDPEEIKEKVRKEADEWCLAQVVEEEKLGELEGRSLKIKRT